jgi:hypothetical protein
MNSPGECSGETAAVAAVIGVDLVLLDGNR